MRCYTASVTSAPAVAKARAVSIPIQEAQKITTVFFPDKSIPLITSSAVE